MRNIYMRSIILLALLAFLIFGVGDAITKFQQRKHFSQRLTPPATLPPSAMSEKFPSLTAKNLSKLEEVFLFQQDKHKEFIAISEMENSRNILGVTKDGFLYRWKVTPSSLILDSVFRVTHFNRQSSSELPSYKISAGISFSRDGEFIIVPSELNDDGIYGLSVWNSENSNLVDCMGREQFCPDWGRSDDTFASLVLHPLRNLYLAAFKNTLTGWYEFGHQGENGFERFNGRVKEKLVITRLAIDFYGDYLATADSSGAIQILDISGYKQPPQNPQNVFSYQINSNDFSLQKKEPDNVIDLEFDDTHSWIGWLTNENLIIWSLRNYYFPLHFKTNLPAGNAISFDRSGQLLAVATQEGIKIFDVEDGKEIANYAVGPVTAIYFSRDNRLLIWGDANGNIHLWGVK